MAALPVTVYRWDDPGAPQLTGGNIPNDIINVLKKCLVEGYGTKTALGWTIPRDDAINGKIQFRNSPTDGTGGVVQVWANGDPTVIGLTRVQPGLAATDFDALSQPGYITNIGATMSQFKEWCLIGTTRGFYFVNWRENTTMGGNNAFYEHITFIGDYDSFEVGDQRNFIAVGTTQQNGDFTSTSITSYTQAFEAVLRGVASSYPSYGAIKVYNADGELGDYNVHLPYRSFNTSVYTVSPQKVPAYIPVMLWKKNTSLSSSTADPNVLRGLFPGMLTELITRYNDTDTGPIIDTIDGQQSWLCRSSGRTVNIWINMESWYA